MLRLIQRGSAEAIGTFAMVFVGCGAASLRELNSNSISSFDVALIFGLVVSAMIYALGHISGAHFNPVVTLAFTLSKHFPAKNLVVYWMFQLMGALLAVFLLTLLFPQSTSWGATIPQINEWQALGWEIILTFFLIFVIIAVATDTRAQGVMAGAAIGATVAVCAAVGGSFSGASMNPVRSLAPAIFSHQFFSLWIYFVGPIVGAVIAALLYRFIRCETEPKSAEGCCE